MFNMTLQFRHFDMTCLNLTIKPVLLTKQLGGQNDPPPSMINQRVADNRSSFGMQAVWLVNYFFIITIKF